MKNFIKIQVSIILILSLLIGFNIEENIVGYILLPLKLLIIIPMFAFTIIMMPIMLFTYNWGIEIYTYIFILFLIIAGFLFYGWKNRSKFRGQLSISIAIWGYTFASIMFMGSHY